MDSTTKKHRRIGCAGFCRRCGKEHSLPTGPAIIQAQELMELLALRQHIDPAGGPAPRDPSYSTVPLFGEARGKMFGVLVCRDHLGRQQTLRAFSGQFNGCWQMEGWAPPLFSLESFREVHDSTEKQIKTYGRMIDDLKEPSEQREVLVATRRELSRKLMQDIHGLYRVRNFRGQSLPLSQTFLGEKGMPTGTGDCCAPKLLNQAASQGLHPISLAEFYWGRENLSKSKEHGQFYSSCSSKCAPILGFMLCGVEGHD
jgi:hypothetical protein